MTNNAEAVLRACRLGRSGRSSHEGTACGAWASDADEASRIAGRHRVYLQWLANHVLPDGYAGGRHPALMQCVKLHQEGLRVVALLQGKGLRVLPIKGIAIQPRYPTNELRQLGDIDLVVLSPADCWAACSMVMSEGYEPDRVRLTLPWDPTVAGHSLLHFGEVDFRHPAKGTAIDFSIGDYEFFKGHSMLSLELWQRSVTTTTLTGQVIRIPSVEDMLLLLVAHIYHHLVDDASIRMRDINDAWVLVTHEPFDWSYVVSKSRDSGVSEGLLYLLMGVSRFFDLDAPLGLEESLVRKRVHRRFIDLTHTRLVTLRRPCGRAWFTLYLVLCHSWAMRRPGVRRTRLLTLASEVGISYICNSIAHTSQLSRIVGRVYTVVARLRTMRYIRRFRRVETREPVPNTRGAMHMKDLRLVNDTSEADAVRTEACRLLQAPGNAAQDFIVMQLSSDTTILHKNEHGYLITPDFVLTYGKPSDGGRAWLPIPSS